MASRADSDEQNCNFATKERKIDSLNKNQFPFKGKTRVFVFTLGFRTLFKVNTDYNTQDNGRHS